MPPQRSAKRLEAEVTYSMCDQYARMHWHFLAYFRWRPEVVAAPVSSSSRPGRSSAEIGSGVSPAAWSVVQVVGGISKSSRASMPLRARFSVASDEHCPSFPARAPSPLGPNDIAPTIQRDQRRALIKHSRQTPSSSSHDVIASKVQRGEHRALPQQPCQTPSPFIPDIIACKIQGRPASERRCRHCS